MAAQQALQAEHISGVIALGCLIRGETAHFEMISRACIDGLMRVSLDEKKPIGLGVITCENLSQAKERSGEEKNKGEDAGKAVGKSWLSSFFKEMLHALDKN